MWDLIAPGDKIEIRKIDKNSDKDKIKTYYSQIYDIIEDNDTLKIAMPLMASKVILLGLDMTYEIFIINEKGMYVCQGILVNRYREKKLFIAEIKLYTKLEKFQRRQFFRLDTNIAIKYKVIKDEEVEKFLLSKTEEQRNTVFLDKEYLDGITLDISGGGLRFTSDKPHKRGEYIKLEFSATSQGSQIHFSIIAEIVLSDKVPNRTEIFDHRVSYYMISNRAREDLIKYIFEEERRYRKNEKG